MSGRGSAFEAWVARARAVPIEAEAAQRGITVRGRNYAGPCPVCGGRDRFWIDTVKQAFGCRKCGTGGDVIKLVEHLDDVDFKTACKMLARDRPQIAAVAKPTKTGTKAENPQYALRIWHDARAAACTLVEAYLRSRGITIAAPPSLRFAPRLWHQESGTAWPAMVALVTRGTDGAPVAVHRTFLDPAGGKAPVKPVKMSLGPVGGGAVRLAPVVDFLMVGEGIETCLAAMQATGLPAWSAVSAPGLRGLALPEEIRKVTILADGDDDGEEAALDAGRRWKREGRAVRIARPPRGKDFADMLQEEIVA